MRFPLTHHGARELILYGVILLVAIGLALEFFWPVAVVPFLLLVFLISFFRDPRRTPPEGPEAAVAPADGKVVDIEVVEEPHFIKGQALRIGIFLSVFNVHVNRIPLDGRVTGMHYSPGKFLDVRDPRCADLNEANLVGFEGPRGPFAIRQVAGLIARKIVWPLREGDEVARGQRAGMIKFGSRTELFVPADADVETAVEIGQMVHGAETVLLRYRT